ncbi:MAG: hypothetical protein EON89_12400 [Brevundimonas sp.]|nr:MAG: hypothetical protein EON89_12400 [Brevundimonas sp.]
MPGPHDVILAKAAKETLGPLGFKRKGRSRTWLLDRNWWLLVVEFQPSGWSKGSYLNVSAHWLWTGNDFISFDFGGRVLEFVGYETDAQFTPLAQALAERAGEEAQKLMGMFSSIGATAEFLLSDEALARPHPSWRHYHAGVAAALVGNAPVAAALFGAIVHDDLKDKAEAMARLLDDLSVFKAAILSLIAQHRDVLSLPAKDIDAEILL